MTRGLRLQYIHQNSKPLAPVIYFADQVWTCLWDIWAENYAQYTWFLSQIDQPGKKRMYQPLHKKKLRAYCSNTSTVPSSWKVGVRGRKDIKNLLGTILSFYHIYTGRVKNCLYVYQLYGQKLCRVIKLGEYHFSMYENHFELLPHLQRTSQKLLVLLLHCCQKHSFRVIKLEEFPFSTCDCTFSLELKISWKPFWAYTGKV